MEVEAAARRMLLTNDAVRGYVVDKVYRNRLGAKIDGTSGRAIVVYRNNGWATPDPVTSQEYPILAMKFYADPTRDEGDITKADAEDKALAIYRVVNPLLHGRRGFRMGGLTPDTGLMVVTAARWKEPAIVTEKDEHGPTQGDPLGDTVYAYVEYALQVIH